MSPRGDMSTSERQLARRLAAAEAELARLRSKGPQLGVSNRRPVKTAGGRVGQWWTPPWLAALFVLWAGLDRAPMRRRLRVLDAGAGKGALSLAALEFEHVDVTMVERDKRLIATLERVVARYPERSRVVHADFLEGRRRQAALFDVDELRGFDVVVSNPPWEGNLPERFNLRALELSERVCSIVPLNMQCGGERSGFWQSVSFPRGKALPNRPKFGGGGGMRDVMLTEVMPKGWHSGPTRMEVG